MTLPEAEELYVQRFDVLPPQPINVSDERMVEVLLAHIAKGRPVTDAFDWWSFAPPGATS